MLEPIKMDLDSPRSWASQLHLTLWQVRVSPPEWIVLNGEESLCKNLGFFPSDDVLPMKMHQRLISKIWASLVSWILMVCLYVCLSVSVCMDGCTYHHLPIHVCPHVPACVRLFNLVQLFTAEISWDAWSAAALLFVCTTLIAAPRQ